LKASELSFVTVRQISCLLGAMFALVVADGLITNFLMIHGLGREWNPLLQTFVGGESFLQIKVAGAFLSVVILWEIYKKRPQMATIGSFCILIFYTGIVYWNLFVFLLAHV